MWHFEDNIFWYLTTEIRACRCEEQLCLKGKRFSLGTTDKQFFLFSVLSSMSFFSWSDLYENPWASSYKLTNIKRWKPLHDVVQTLCVLWQGSIVYLKGSVCYLNSYALISCIWLLNFSWGTKCARTLMNQSLCIPLFSVVEHSVCVHCSSCTIPLTSEDEVLVSLFSSWGMKIPATLCRFHFLTMHFARNSISVEVCNIQRSFYVEHAAKFPPKIFWQPLHVFLSAQFWMMTMSC